MDRVVFFARVRRVFGGQYTQGQVDGLNRLLDVWEQYRPFQDLRWLAYCLATSYHETAHTMHPVEEIGGKNRSYGQPHPVTGHRYYGRGDVQLTHYENYVRAGHELGVDLVGNPELAREPVTSARILFTGCRDGWFTGHKLGTHLTDAKTDWLRSRRIVNGTDRAAAIAGYAKEFYAALVAAVAAKPQRAPPAPAPGARRMPLWPWVAGAAAAAAVTLVAVLQ